MIFAINLSLFSLFVQLLLLFEIQVYYAQLFPFIYVEPSLKIKSQCDGEHSQNIEKRVFNLVRVGKKSYHKRRCQTNEQLEFYWTQVFVLRINTVTLTFYRRLCQKNPDAIQL